MTSQAEYAVAALVELALAPANTSVRSPEIARRLAVPAPSLEQVLVRLRRHGLVRSFRGAQGGYALARDAADITLLEVLTVFLSAREGERPQVPEVAVRQVTVDHAEKLEETLSRSAADLTVEQLAEEARRRNEAMAVMPGL